MKSNHAYLWEVVLSGRGKRQIRKTFLGTIDEVLNYCDEIECGVRWLVLSVEVRRAAA